MHRRTQDDGAMIEHTVIHVYIDGCAWNYLFDRKLDLLAELPAPEFSLYMTREVRIELEAIPEIGAHGSDKRALRDYIRNSLDRIPIFTVAPFGFRTCKPAGAHSEPQVYSGFNCGKLHRGGFQSAKQRAYYASAEVRAHLAGSRRPTGLGRNQADASLAAHAEDAFILTDENPGKSGPIRDAADAGKKVVYLRAQVEPSGLTIGQYIKSQCPRTRLAT
jgi:hypothetical protein